MERDDMSLKGKPYYNQLKDEIEAILEISPYLDELTVYNFLRGKRSEELERYDRLTKMCEAFHTKPDEVMVIIKSLEKNSKTNKKRDMFGIPDDAA